MGELGNITDYFAGGNTKEGFYSLFQYISDPAEMVYIIKGGPGTGKSTLMKGIGERFIESGFDVEYHHCSSDPDSLDGLVCKRVKFAVLDGTPPHVVNPKFPGIKEQIINLGAFWDKDKLWKNRKEIKNCMCEVEENFSEAYRYLKNAGGVYDHLSMFYRRGRDLEKLEDLVFRIWEEMEGRKKPGQGEIRHLFASALTPAGMINYFDQLTAEIKRRFILRAPPGSGKSWMLKHLVEKAGRRGHDLTVFHCGYSPQELDLVLFHNLDAAVIDGGWPHTVKFEPTEDTVIDFGNLGLLKSFREEIKENMEELRNAFQGLLSSGLDYIKEAYLVHNELEKYYIEAMDFTASDRTEEDLFNQVLQRAEKRSYI